MPQMAPLWWSTLYLIIISTFIMIKMMMYFNTNYKVYSKKSKKETKSINWMW
uniref:ATP synthase F0 subunit 8 n=1 Tax=Camarochiloides weiweii TaxID=2785926 RepID=A0A873QKG8_9HEMI|nr:ATP synthase F0 subunit 8 [Camarochiloides weiweii]